MIKEKLRRISELYNILVLNEEALKQLPSEGKKASIRRHQVFLKSKIVHAFQEIREEMQPKIFAVYLSNRNHERKTVLMRAESYDDIKLYIELLGPLNGEIYTIDSIKAMETIYGGHVNITIHTETK